jgi:hypothetical protein
MNIRGALLGFAFVAASLPGFGAVITYVGILSGANESPATGSPGTGFAAVTVDDIVNTMRVQVNFSGLTGTTTASHIHCCTTPNAGVATTTPTFAGFPLGVTSGTYDRTLDLTLASSYNPAFITANGGTPASAEAVLLAGLAAGNAYLNVHSTTFGGGEIRANLLAAPEPGGLAIVGAALGALVLVRRRYS